jgi:hypothetical protein
MKYLKKIKKSIFENELTRDLLMNGETISYDNGKAIVTFPKSSKRRAINIEELDFSTLFEFAKKSLFGLNYIKFISNLSKEDAKKEIKGIDRILSLSFNFIIGGQKVIKVGSHSLLNQLENTKIQESINASDVTIPHDVFYVSLEQSFNKDTLYIDGAFIEKFEDGGFMINPLFRFKDRFDYVPFIFNEDESIYAVIKKTCSDFCKSLIDADIENIFKQAISNILRIIIYHNIVSNKDNILYEMEIINKENYQIMEDVKHLTKNKIKKHLKQIADSNYYYVLKNNSTKCLNIEKELNSGKKIEKQFMVSGHYRKQPFGIRENIKYKIIWIEPYIKGIYFEKENKMKIIVI